VKILMFGRGAIATQYGWALERAGNTVEFYVRPGRAAQYGPSVNLEILDARVNRKGTLIKEDWTVVLREDLTADHDYDLIVVSVNHYKFAEAVAYLESRVGRATVLVFNNLWSDPQSAIASLPAGQVVWGFPGSGGGFDERGVLKGMLLKKVFFGTLRTELTARDNAVRDLFRSAGLSVSEKRDFRSWLWSHFIFDAGLLAQALQAGGLAALADSPTQLSQAFLNVRELLPVLAARGVRPAPVDALPFRLPAGLLGLVLQKTLLAPGSVGRRAMETNNNEDEMRSFPRDALAEARRFGVPAPRLAALEPLFQ
jgi:2-dehydropantoate 2-reductase